MKLLSLLAAAALLVVSSCASMKSADQLPGSGPINLTETAKSDKYGYSENSPIKVGGVSEEMGPAMERKFLNQLAGPNGEEITYDRIKSCCQFETPRGFAGGGLLDVYEITWKGLSKPKTIYINMYDYENPMIPVGLTRK